MATIEQDINAIRHAVYGRDVREAIADGIEICHSDISGAVSTANAAAQATREIYTTELELTEAQQETARQNMNAAKRIEIVDHGLVIS